MPSHCFHDCACACTVNKYKIRGVEISEKEYEKIKKAIGGLKSEKRRDRGDLEKRLEEIKTSISNEEARLRKLETQYQKLSKQYQEYTNKPYKP